MSEMVERVATAIFDAGERWDEEEPALAGHVPYDVLARAAIEAMREPNMAMLNKANRALDRDKAAVAYRAMIDAALSSPASTR
jgi:hypothetical protein